MPHNRVAPPYRVAILDWQTHHVALSRVRQQVFVDEQRVPLALELDALDANYTHAAGLDPRGHIVATGRLLPDGQIGRMAVLKSWRGGGLGRDLLTCLVAQARDQQLQSVWLHAQVRVQGFYAKFGFVAVGDVFLEAGLQHIKMQRRL